MSQPEEAPKGKRERSARYPGAPLADVIELCRFLDARGLDGLTASDIGTALGYKNIKTSAVSTRLSAARQFGMLALDDSSYSLTPLARAIVHPVDPGALPDLYRQALQASPLYAELVQRFAGKKVPEAAILGNVLYHHHQITTRAKEAAAEVFLESLRFAGALAEDNTLRLVEEVRPASAAEPEGRIEAPSSGPATVRIDLRLWGGDEGKVVRVRAPAAITSASFERLVQAIRLHVRVEDE